MMLVLSVLPQQSEQKEESSLHATCNLFSADQLQPRREGRKGGKAEDISISRTKGIEIKKRKERKKEKKKKEIKEKGILNHRTGT